MNSLKNLIARNIEDFPDFEYYTPIIGKVERNQEPHPDISIECCLPLFQGISKSIILRLDSNVNKDELENRKVSHQFKQAAKLIKINNDVFEDLFVNQCSNLAKSIGELRNARGDISHGRAVPKVLQSDIGLARLVMEITDSLLRYTLCCFFAIDLDKKAKEIEELQRIEQDEESLIRYEDNPEFNNFIDEEYPYYGKLLYSEALYKLVYEDYAIQLQEFIDELKGLDEQ